MARTKTTTTVDDNPSGHGTMREMRIRVGGTVPMLQCAPTGLDPMHPLTLLKQKLTSKRGRAKTLDDHRQIYWIEFQMGLYHDDAIGPYIPGTWFEGALVRAATMQKLGKQAKAGLWVIDFMVPLKYQGPRDVKGLFDAGFLDKRPVRKRVMLCRPMFSDWEATFTIRLDDSLIDITTLKGLLADAGAKVGIGDYRPRFGRFDVLEAEEL